jgi:hypothetical protein
MNWLVLTWTLHSQGFVLKNNHVRCSSLVSEFISCLSRYDQFEIINVHICNISSSPIGNTAHCGLWPVEQCPILYIYIYIYIYMCVCVCVW